ncbi:hypothetical protein [Streptomyces sp. NBC_01589]|uniref:hypothetical protein n=1 Tax=unclassified Streptomyces TaxID=2593676 RepID=UPI0038646EB8
MPGDLRDGRIVIVGASLAGLRAAETLRKEGLTGSLTVVGDEPHPHARLDISQAWGDGTAVAADGTHMQAAGLCEMP